MSAAGRELSLENDFRGVEGCKEILNDTRPDVLAHIHGDYFATGIDGPYHRARPERRQDRSH
jgi:methionine synthase I (cobalamin-dependent)